LVVYPTELGFIGTTRYILEKEGTSSLFTGLGASLILTSNPAIQFMIFDRLKLMWIRILQARGEDARPPSAFELFVIGAM